MNYVPSPRVEAAPPRALTAFEMGFGTLLKLSEAVGWGLNPQTPQQWPSKVGALHHHLEDRPLRTNGPSISQEERLYQKVNLTGP